MQAAERRSGDRDAEPTAGTLRALTVASLLGLPAIYFLSFFNRFAGLRSGAGEYAGGVLFLSGVLPYRDYFTAGPPLNTLKSALLLKVFGMTLLVSRSAGAAERLLICCVLYLWLRRLFSRVPALVASVATTILSAADCTDPIASYNHDAILWAMLSGWLASLLLGRKAAGAEGPDPGPVRGGGWRSGLLAMLSGVCASMSICTKQTVGLAAALAVVLCLGWGLSRRRLLRRAMVLLLLFLVGCAIPLGALALALTRWGLLGSMLRMLFVTGPQAKATHPGDFLLRELSVGWGNVGWVVLGTAALASAWPLLWRGLLSAGGALDPGKHDVTSHEREQLLTVLIGGCAVLGLSEAISLLTSWPALHDITKGAVYFGFLGLTAMMVCLAWRLVRRRSATPQLDLWLMLAVSWAVAMSLSLSWPAFEAMLLPGLGLLLAAVLTGARGSSRKIAYAGLAMAVFLSVREKLDRPFLFDGQQELPVRLARSRSPLPAMRGMRLPESTVAMLDGVTEIVRQNTREGDTLFTYPEMGLLYAVTGRQPPTFAMSHNIDVVNDALARADAGRLLAAPPAVIVFYRESETEMRGAEALWREGRPSGQRELFSAVERLAGGYRLAATYRLGPADSPIEVYVRK